jgi:hypothetical protein
MKKGESEETQVYRSLINNLESLKRREGTTGAERHALTDIQQNLARLAGGAASVRARESNSLGSYGFCMAF